MIVKIKPCILNLNFFRRTNDLVGNNLRVEQNSSGSVNQSLLTVPRIPGDAPQVCSDTRIYQLYTKDNPGCNIYRPKCLKAKK